MRQKLSIELDLELKGFECVEFNEFSSYSSPTTYRKENHSFTLALGTVIGDRRNP